MKNLPLDKSSKITFFSPVVVYFIFIWVFVISRFFFLSLLFGNGYLLYRTRRFNLTPFATIQWSNYLLFIINLFLFTPAGLYIHAISKKKNIIKSILICFLLIVGVETTQFILASGSFDIDDIILNTVGMVAGVFVSHLVFLAFKKDYKQSNALISAVSAPLSTLFLAALLKIVFLFEASLFVPLCIVGFLLIFLLFYQLFTKETKLIKTVYVSSCIILSLLFFSLFFFLSSYGVFPTLTI